MFLGVVLAVLVTAVAVGVFLLGRGGLPAGRLARLARVGRMSAALSASWLGASVRRLAARGARRQRIDEAHRRAAAQRIADTMGHMKGAFMKLGQMLSYVSEQVPPEFRHALTSLQTAAAPLEFPLVRDVAERELERPLERAFARFDEKPLASASIGQVHRATLPSGEAVAVKVQYPGVAEAIRGDLANAALLYAVAGRFYPHADTGAIVDELRERLTEELDYRREAENQEHFAALYAGHPFIRIPRVFPSHSTASVLTSEFVEGRRFEDLVAAPDAERQRFAEILYRFVFGSIAHHGVFNGDPHPGNYLFQDDGRMAFLDFGCIKRFPADMLAVWRELVGAHLAGEREEFRRRAVALGFLREDAPVSAALLHDYFGYFYEPFRADREFEFTSDYASRSLKMVFAPDGPYAGIDKQLNMPRHFVFVNRIQWGVYSILVRLRARANWYRIHRELFFGGATSTELGRSDADWRAVGAGGLGRGAVGC